MYGPSGNARVRVLHTSPDAPAVDIHVDGSPAITNLSFGQISDYVELRAGMHSVKVFAAGTGRKGNAVIDADLEVEANQAYTVAAVRRLQNVQAMVISDSTSPPGPGMAKVRVIHASPDAPGVDVGVPGGPTLFRNISFMEITPFTEVQSGTYDLEVRPAGSMQAVVVVPNVSLDSANLYTFAAMGLLRGTPSLMVMPIVDRVRVPV